MACEIRLRAAATWLGSPPAALYWIPPIIIEAAITTPAAADTKWQRMEEKSALTETTSVAWYLDADNVAADSIGSPNYNFDLSQRRANAVVRWLRSAQGLHKGNFQTKAWGLTRPVAPNTTEENRQQNRRVEILLIA